MLKAEVDDFAAVYLQHPSSRLLKKEVLELYKIRRVKAKSHDSVSLASSAQSV